jgi:hypothetical protein
MQHSSNKKSMLRHRALELCLDTGHHACKFRLHVLRRFHLHGMPLVGCQIMFSMCNLPRFV